MRVSLTQCPVHSTAARPDRRCQVGDGLGGRRRLAESLAVEIEHRVARDDQGIGAALGDGFSFAPGEHLDGGGGVGRVDGLVDAAHDDLGAQSAIGQDTPSGR